MQEMEYGASTEDMPPIEVITGMGDEMIIFNGVTRATRAYQYHPEEPILVEVTDNLPHIDMSRYQTIKEVHDGQGNAGW